MASGTSSESMSSRASSPHAKEEDSGRGWSDLIASLRKVVDNPSFIYLERITKENAKLAEENQKLITTEERNICQIGALAHKLDNVQASVEGKDSEIAALKDRLKTAEAEAKTAQKSLEDKITSHKAEILKLESSVKEKEGRLERLKVQTEELLKDKKDAEDRLKEKSDRLGEIGGWVYQMGSADAETVAGLLDKLFSTAYDLAVRYFVDDLPENVCREESNWKALRGYDKVNHPHVIPLPALNSPEAKGMRVAAFLTALGHHLTEQVFQPLYVLEDGTPLYELLSDVAHDDPNKEAFIRSALLSLRTPEEYQEQGHQRTSKVCSALLLDLEVGKLVLGIKQKGFEKDLVELCRDCCNTWTRIQRLDDKVECIMQEDTEEDDWVSGDDLWDQLGLPELDSKGQVVRTRTENGVAAAQRATSTHQANGDPPRPGRAAPPNDLSMEGIKSFVWPCFYYVTSEGRELLRSGVALGESQVKVARSQLASIKRSDTTRRRDARAKERAQSIGNSDAKPPRYFLSKNGSAGPGAG